MAAAPSVSEAVGVTFWMQPDPFVVDDVELLGPVDRAIALPARVIPSGAAGAGGARFVVLAWSGTVLQA